MPDRGAGGAAWEVVVVFCKERIDGCYARTCPCWVQMIYVIHHSTCTIYPPLLPLTSSSTPPCVRLHDAQALQWFCSAGGEPHSEPAQEGTDTHRAGHWHSVWNHRWQSYSMVVDGECTLSISTQMTGIEWVLANGAANLAEWACTRWISPNDPASYPDPNIGPTKAGARITRHSFSSLHKGVHTGVTTTLRAAGS